MLTCFPSLFGFGLDGHVPTFCLLLYLGKLWGGLLQGRFRVDPHQNYLAASIIWAVLFLGVLIVRALLCGVCIRAANF